jgi:hypothetical protein
MNSFTNHNVPGSVGDGTCYTAFYEGDVSTELILPDGSQAQIVEWNPNANFYLEPPRFEKVTIVKVTEIPNNRKSWKMLSIALMHARHLNIRLVLPRGAYPAQCRNNIDSE